MTPKELEAYKARLTDFWLDRDKEMLRALFAHIEQQAAQNHLLKEKLEEERATRIIEGQPFCLVANTDQDILGEEDSCEHEGNCELSLCPNAKWYMDKAREQLRAETPEVFDEATIARDL